MKMNCIKISLCFLSMLVGFVAISQDNTPDDTQWNLDKCINHAIQNNSRIQRQILNSDIATNTLEATKLSRLPSLGASFGNTTSWGRTLSDKNVYLNRNSNTTSFNVNADVKLFQGFALKNEIIASKYDLEYQKNIIEVNEANLTIEVTQAFLNVLVTKELLELTKEQIDITEKQINITTEKVSGGLLDKGPLLELRSQLANNKAEEVDARNSLQLNILELAQLMEVEDPKTVVVQIPKLALINAETQLNSAENYFATALKLRPEIKAANTRIKQGDANEKAAKGGLYPTLSANASYSNGYYHYSGIENVAFNDQLSNNGQENLGLRLSIPIFYGKRARNSYKNAKIQALQSKLDLVQAEKDLRKTVTNALTQARGSHEKYSASSTLVNTSKESFDFADLKFNSGAMEIYDYNQAKNSYIRAKSQKIRAKYEFIFKTKMLEFYTGKKISL
ncbi:TolC family protein [Prolixibacteraceae bacterium]|nr:TolC family protein [Prolixibacteraceae bacterium]